MAEVGEKKIFQKKEESERREEEKKELTPEMRYVLESISGGEILNLVRESLKEHPEYSQYEIAREIAEKEKKSIKGILRWLRINKNIGLLTIEIEEGTAKIKRVNLEKLEELWKESRGAKILKLVEEKEFITSEQISEMLEEWSYAIIRAEVLKLESVGLVKSIKFGGKRIVYSPSAWEQKIGEGKKLTPSEIVRREMSALKEALERIKEIDKEIKRTKEAKEK